MAPIFGTGSSKCYITIIKKTQPGGSNQDIDVKARLTEIPLRGSCTTEQITVAG